MWEAILDMKGDQHNVEQVDKPGRETDSAERNIYEWKDEFWENEWNFKGIWTAVLETLNIAFFGAREICILDRSLKVH